MSKTKQKGEPSLPRRLIEQEAKALDLVESGHVSEALPILEELDQSYPNRLEILGLLFNAYLTLDNTQKFEKTAWRLSRIEPRNPDVQFGLASAYLINLRPALALKTFRAAVSRWPNDPQAATALESIKKIETELEAQAKKLNLPVDLAIDLLGQNDELRFFLAHADYRRGIQVAEQILRTYPNFVPALNNLSQIYAQQGEIHKAIQTAQQILTIEPDNIHALSNLTRLYFLTGQPLEAQEYANQLKQSKANAADRWTKIAEALAFLADNQGILNLYEQAKAAKELEPPYVDEIFYHLLAVANWQLGNEPQARHFWQKALRINPNFHWARANLEDATKNIKKRCGVWTYPFESWLLARTNELVEHEMSKLKKTKIKTEMQTAFKLSLEKQCPEVLFLAKHLIERGDARAASFVVHMAAMTAHPTLVEAAKTYISGSRGAFEERFEMSKVLSEAGLLPPGPVHMWNEGEWQDLMMLDIEIFSEPVKPSRSQAAQKLYEEAYEALQNRKGKLAQELLEKALVLSPEDPGIQNSLSVAHQIQGHRDIARQMILETYSRFPDYFFGIVAAANIETEKGNLEKARQMLNSLMNRERMHISEFRALCVSQLQISLAEKNKEAARSWLDLWARVEPNDPDLAYYRLRVEGLRKLIKWGS